ncbi:adenine-specific DNA-methyltransferase [Microbulbifer donghaiensis]|uniref:Methyltransferase n=1 Tax=Microbulbifer donghaiensis TaxID=494016 RepID=A0A1M4W593_9GAMM|nr:site-specific DNA-methyltransferase [Microbulbifer donghaiensis]SHE76386.1 adenine-specific DNA-methyltransferase [Microbulbifer donghaiensis]
MLKKIKKYSSPKTDGKTRKIILGDNLDVLSALRADYKSKVKCVYIDPPYNNGEKYTHYDDSTHDLWLSDLKKRLKSLRDFLRDDGSIWISIDDGEVHYLKVAADEVFGRKNFITTVVWQQRTTRENRKHFSNNHEYILVYAKERKKFVASINKLPPTDDVLSRYKNPDNDPKGPWQSVSVNVQAGHAVKSQFYKLVSPAGVVHAPPNGRCWAYNESKMLGLIEEGRIWFGKDGAGVPRLKKYLSESRPGLTPETLWFADTVGTNKEAKKHLLKLFPGKDVFDTPKPERLIQQIFEIATNEGDLILDSYLGAGASVAVAHKMKRQYIGIDKGQHIIDYVIERQKMVMNGTGYGVLERVSDKTEGFEFFKFSG